MNKLMGIFLLGTALSLTACGGDSDSSGSVNSNSNEPIGFLSLPNCEIEGNNIVVEQFARGCLVKKPNINKGKTFSLSCSVPDTTINIEATEDGDIQGVKRDIELSPTGKYSYECRSRNRS